MSQDGKVSMLVGLWSERGLVDQFKAVCAKYHATVEDVLGHGKGRRVRDARVDLILQLRALGFTYREICQLFGRAFNFHYLLAGKKDGE